jgi:hypothetical protein
MLKGWLCRGRKKSIRKARRKRHALEESIVEKPE